jgi:hypothetical protein
MSRYAKFCAVIAGVSLALGACTTLQVATDVNPNYSVATCHSYSFAQEHVSGNPNAAFGNPLNSDRLRTAIESNLAARGVAKVADPAAADCVVGYALGTRQVFNDYYGGWGVGYGWGWRRGWGGGYWGYDGPWVENETRIAIDVFDAKSHKPMWHGSVSETMSDLSGPNAEGKIAAATAAIFGKLPIGTAPAAVAAQATPPPAVIQQGGFFMYPKNGQSQEQQATDQRECEQWATQQAHGSTSGTDFRRAMVACIEGRGYSVN